MVIHPEISLPWTEQGIEAWARYSAKDLEAIPDQELGRFERRLVSELQAAGVDKARTLGEVLERTGHKARAEGKRFRAKPIAPADLRWNIAEQLREYRRLQEDRRSVSLAEQNRRLAARADHLAEARFREWTTERDPRGRDGHPIEYRLEDAARVGRVEQVRQAQSERGQRFFEVTDRLESAFFPWLERARVFGERTLVESHPTTKFDDYVRGVDAVVRLEFVDGKGQARQVSLGIDFTIGASEEQIAAKLQRLVEQPHDQLKYGTEHLAAGEWFYRGVLSIDPGRAERMYRHLALLDAAADQPGTDFATLEKAERLAAQYRDPAVFRGMVVEELSAQIALERKVLAGRQADPAVLDELLALEQHLAGLAQEQKTLHQDAQAEVVREGLSHFYRTRDGAFIARVQAGEFRLTSSESDVDEPAAVS